jgi:hypothetical protein
MISDLIKDQIETLYDEGYTYHMIAERLHVTRSLVAGQVYRMNLSKRTRPGRGPDKSPRKPKSMPAPKAVRVVVVQTRKPKTVIEQKHSTRSRLYEDLRQAVLNTAAMGVGE